MLVRKLLRRRRAGSRIRKLRCRVCLHKVGEVVDAYVRGAAVGAVLAGRGGDRAHRAERAATGLAWVVAGAVAVALAGVALL